MLLFNFFRKKEPKYNLDTLFEKGVNEPEYRIKFLQTLLSGNLIVLAQYGTDNQAFRIPIGNTMLNVFVLADGRVPIFTCVNKVFDKGIIDPQAAYYQLDASTLFKYSKGKTFILNPSSDIQKEFSPGEIERLLNGAYFDNTIYFKKLEENMSVRIKQPPVYPEKLVASLTKLFLERPNVKSCYVAWIDNPAMSDSPHYIFAVDVTDEFENICKEMGFLIREILAEGTFVEFMQFNATSGLHDYFINGTKPFYKSSK
jgi:hypothetical protein